MALSLAYLALTSAFMIWRGVSVSPDYLLLLLLPVALASGRLWRFLGDWVPFVVVFLGWEAMRGVAPKAGIPPHVADLARLESTLFAGHLPTAVLQSWLANPPGRVVAYAATIVYFSHFVFPIGVAMALWLVDRRQFLRFTTALMGMCFVAFGIFVLAPTAPPWYAEAHGAITGVHKIIATTLPSAISPYYAALNPNPVAAFPSLHAAFPFLGFLAVRETFAPRAAWLGLAWCFAVWFSVVYLGEHYVVDVMAGVGLAALTWWVMNRGVQMSLNDLIRCGLDDWSVNTFHRHMLEMTLSMVIPWSAFWMVVHFGLPSAGLTPAWFFLMPIGIAVMVVPMTALMLYRRHSGRDIVEMNASMFVGMLLVMPVVHMALPSMGVQVSLEVLFPIALVAMTAPMIVLMYVRREHYTHHAHAG